MLKNFFAMLKDDSGATLVEYTLIVAIVGIGSIAALKSLGSNTQTALNGMATSVGTQL